jgi:hypothetical protein
VVEDLGSANGTYVRGARVARARVKVGDEVHLGQARLPWHDARLRPLVRRAAGGTVEARAVSHRAFVCGGCGAQGRMPTLFHRGELRCGACGRILVFGAPVVKKRGRARAGLGATLVLLLVVGGAATAYTFGSSGGPERLQEAAERLGVPATPGNDTPARTPEERAIRIHAAPRVVLAMDSSSEVTRNTAVQLAAKTQGAFNVEQVAWIWSEVRKRWRYVNDPRGGEYFARASETINNEYAGDCDDFGIVLVSMIGAIGGDARLVMMDGPQGGHAYAEVCLPEPVDDVRRRLTAFYGSRRLPRSERQRVTAINYRPSETCSMWLNLDWNAGVPGGPYEPEHWAVAIYPDGRTETLAPAGQPGLQVDGQSPSGTRVGSPP